MPFLISLTHAVIKHFMLYSLFLVYSQLDDRLDCTSYLLFFTHKSNYMKEIQKKALEFRLFDYWFFVFSLASVPHRVIEEKIR